MTTNRFLKLVDDRYIAENKTDFPNHQYRPRFDAFMKEYLTTLIERFGRNASQISQVSGLNRGTVRKYLDRYGL